MSQLHYSVQRKQNDIYSLGMTLLSAFYLSEIVDLEIVTDENHEMVKRYEILLLINAMVDSPEKRPTIQ